MNGANSGGAAGQLNGDAPPTGAGTSSATPGLRNRISAVVEKVQPVVPSVGNVARDHLANERTFLAWLRTCLSLVGGGAALTKLGIAWIGNSFVVLGLFALVLSTYQYYHITHLLERGKFQVNKVIVGLVMIGTLVCTCIVIWRLSNGLDPTNST
eukprot:Opistho-2@76802